MEAETAVDGGPEDNARPRLDRERILDAAEAIASSEGIGKLTMRRIGAELGADPTAVYRHFRNKDELLVQLADRLFGTLPEVDPSLSWREQEKVEFRYAMNRYRAHPDLAQLLAVQPDDTPSLQDIANRMLGLLAEQGLDPETAARIFQVIETHIVGTGLYFSLVEHGDDPRLRDADGMRRVYALLPKDTHPHAVAAAPFLFPDLDASFDFATDLILDAIERLAQQRTPDGPPTNDGVPTT
jgi:AcrR family transcriptional regulator